MKPEEFIKLAEKIVGFGPAGARSAISRCYYGALHGALDLLDEVSCSCPRNGNSHNLAPQFLDFPANADAKRASRLLSDLHADRLKSDYKLREAETEDMKLAQVDVETSRQVIEFLERFHSACQAGSVLQAFQAHVAKIKQLRRLP